MKKSWKKLEGKFLDRQKQLSDEKCACGCGGFITNRAAKNKAKGLTPGYIKGHTWKGRKMSEAARQKMRDNHADVSGENNPNYGKGLFGENNPNWQGGKKQKHYKGNIQMGGVHTKHDLEFRKSIRARDKKCVLCHKRTTLEAHHIESWVNHPELRHDPKNCVTLCKSCHARADNRHHKQKFKALLTAYIKTLWA